MSQRLWRWWWVSLITKFVLAAAIPLSLDEAYYWVWSKNLQLSYFDHPGMVAWLFKLGQVFEPFGNAVRWPAVFLGHLTLIVWFLILTPWMKEEKYFGWFLLALFSPLIGFGSLVVTPDLPVVFFWSTSLLFFQRFLEKQNYQLALLLGASLGLGFCSKYQIVLFVPCAFIYVLFEKKWPLFRLRFLISIVLTGLLFSLPVLIWNYKNDFASFAFQLKHGLSRPSWNPFWTYSYIIGQILILFPVPIWLACKARLTGSQRLLIYFSLGPLLFFLFSSSKALVEMNWPIVAYHSFYAISILGSRTLKPLRWTIGFWITISIFAISQAVFAWIPNAPDKLKEFSIFQTTLTAKAKYSPLFAESYQMASFIWYQTKSPTYKLYQMSRTDYYDNLKQSHPLDSVFYVVMDKNASLPVWVDEQGYRGEVREELDSPFVVMRFEKQ